MDYSEFSDRQLVQAYISGKESALNYIIERYQSRLYGYILVSVKDGDVANDIFQDTFMKVIRKLKEGAYNEEGRLCVLHII
jgi:RNA polymerase sigma-70 factor (ECF subfamily)